MVSRLEVLASNFREPEDRLKKFTNSRAEVKNIKAVDLDLLIKSVGIITSVDGAALSDILAVVRDELPYLDIRFFRLSCKVKTLLSLLEIVLTKFFVIEI